MSLEAIAAIDAIPADAALTAVQSPDTAGAAFDSLMSHLQELNAQMAAGQGAVSQLALGKADNLHQVMMNMEQTKLSFELTLAVRNKVLEAYQELMRMQV